MGGKRSDLANLIGWIGTALTFAWLHLAMGGSMSDRLWFVLGTASVLLCLLGSLRGSKWFLIPGALAAFTGVGYGVLI